MQVIFGGHPYLFVNKHYLGQYHPPSEATANLNWFNYGGDKIWPLPEGDQDERHWPGPIADALDDGEYGFKILSEQPTCRVLLEGPPDPQTGLQYSREIGVRSDSPEISFHAVMKNITGHPIEWSMQSVSQYDTSDGKNGLNGNLRAYAPVNRSSAYPDGYYARTGLGHSPAYSVKDDLFLLHWLNLQSEIWLDSTGGWLAVADGASRYAMVERFNYQPTASYPGKATVIFYSNGPTLHVNEKGEPSLSKDNPDDALHYLEAEINSPLVKLSPGETYAMDTKWFPTRIDAPITGIEDAGTIAGPIHVSPGAHGLLLTGSAGVFFSGKLALYFYDRNGIRSSVLPLQAVDPLEPLNLHEEFQVPPSTTRISLHLMDDVGMDKGSLGEAVVPSGNGGS